LVVLTSTELSTDNVLINQNAKGYQINKSWVKTTSVLN